MSEWIELFKDATVIAAIVYGLFQLVSTYQQKKSKDKQSAELILDISTTARNVTEGGDNAVDAMTKVLTVYENRIHELERVQQERTVTVNDLTTQVNSLKDQIELLNRNYAKELSALKRQWKEWYNTLKKWLDEKNMSGYPEPPSDLLDTGDKFKAAK